LNNSNKTPKHQSIPAMHLAAKENDFEVVNETINGDSTAHAPNWVPIRDEHVYAPRKLGLVCICAGYAGLMLAYHLREVKMEEFIDLRIYSWVARSAFYSTQWGNSNTRLLAKYLLKCGIYCRIYA
jgi:hypothetical protein